MTLRNATSLLFPVLISPRNLLRLFLNIVQSVWVLGLLLFVHHGIYVADANYLYVYIQ